MLKADSKMRTIQRVVGAAFAIYCFLVVIGWWPLRRLETFLDPFRTDMFLPEKQFVPPEAYMTTPEIVISRGYQVEVHQVVNKDGYILELHRIVNSTKSPSIDRKKPIFLQHGLTGTDIIWLIHQSNQSLAFLLADLGYDVWMGNYRGNTYSKKHETLDPELEPEYWNYSMDDIGRVDMPAILHYILDVTQEPKVGLIGHSMGSALFFIAAIENMELNEKIEFLVALGPSVINPGITSRIVRIVEPIKNYLHEFMNGYGVYEFMPSAGVLMDNMRWVCESSQIGSSLCTYVIRDLFGHSSLPTPPEMVKVLLHHYPAGGALKTIDHWLQTMSSGHKFLQYDYGSAEKNLKHYGSERPKEYDLKRVTAPVYLFLAENDPLADPKDVARLAGQVGNLRALIRVEDPSFTHGDFLWAPNVLELVYTPIINIAAGYPPNCKRCPTSPIDSQNTTSFF